MNIIDSTLASLTAAGNLRTIPRDDAPEGVIDLSSNDYLGLASRRDLAEDFLSRLDPADFLQTSSASRLLAGRQREYTALEDRLSEVYGGRAALLFNSGYHANTGIIKALGDKNTLFLADKLVHASMIDGLNLAAAAGSTFMRFRHNDFGHLRRLMESHGQRFSRVVILAETVYSMDGDTTDIDALLTVKSLHPNAIVYLDEAHAVGVVGVHGLGMARSHPDFDHIDIVVGTFGKALASMGAYAITGDAMRRYLVNTARSLIFSTALPPLTMRWSLFTLNYAITADAERLRLAELGAILKTILSPSPVGAPSPCHTPVPGCTPSRGCAPSPRCAPSPLGRAGEGPYPRHIQPLVVGDPVRAVELSQQLLAAGYRVLPIRTPTVPPGTDRLRFSLSATLTPSSLLPLQKLLSTI